MSHKNYALKAEKREQAGKGVARALRREGKTPAVIYGDKQAPIKIALGSNDINVAYNRGGMYTTLCDLRVDSEKHLVLARDVQLHPVTDFVEHVDFLRVNDKTTIAVYVPVEFINEDKCPGLEEKGVLNIVRHEVELVCAATNIPEMIEVDLAGKELGEAIHISDAKLPQGTKPVISNRDFTIATLVAPRAIEEEVAAPVEGAEPIIGDGEDAAAEGAEGAEGGEAEAKKGKDD